ncbi:MAG: hypothetical protein JWP74_472 [Marmoricola sp.]|nr:hypothetical protein [Marmoricola sp.]
MSTVVLARRSPGTALLVRLAVRRDRVLVPVWLAVLLLVDLASAASVPGLYPTEADRVRAAEAINASPGIIALYGPVLDVHSTGELAMTKMTVLYALFVAAFFVVLIRRHTRAEEENGQTELVGGTAVGRDAPLLAAVVVGAGLALALGSLAAVVDGLGGLPATGSLAFGASWAGIGLVATAIAAVACQLSASARTCGAVAAGAIGILYLVRAVGDTSVSWLSWVSPYGWSTQLRAWSGPRWWVLGLYVALAVLLLITAQVLRSHRDLGSGLLAARPGPAAGSRYLASPLALELRLNGLALGVWSVALGGTGFVLGAIVPGIGRLLDSPSAQAMIERLGGVGAIQDALVAAELSIVAVVVTCFGIAVVSRAANDETDGRTDLVMTDAASRGGAFGAIATVAFGGTAWLMVLAGTAIGLGHGERIGAAVGAGLAQLPAVWLVTALALLCLAMAARTAVLGWALVGAFVSLGQLGDLLRLPGSVTGLSPYSHVPAVPAVSFDAAPELALAAVTVATVLAAWTRYRTRDIG